MTCSINLETLSKAIAAAEKDIHFYDPPDAELCQALIDAGKAYQSTQWQPIETAPKDGTYILIWIEDSASLGFWNGRTWDDGDFHDDLGTPSHWMPLPAAPKDTP